MRNHAVSRRECLTLLGSAATVTAFSVNLACNKETPRPEKAGIDYFKQNGRWFNEARFGLFMHWGVYAIPGRGEWVMYDEKIPAAEYAKLADQFNPTRFNAEQWAEHALRAGMRYAVLTSRHHDGFCLWDSKVSDFTAPKTAAKRDFLAEYANAFRKAGLRVGFYYSLLDWRKKAYWDGPVKNPQAWAEYLEYVHAQARELCTQYGKLDVFWFDGCWPYDPPSWKSEELLTMIRFLQPEILINDRSALPGDFDTPENAILPSDRGWESCQTTQESWGYNSNEKQLDSLWFILNKLITCASKGGNLLLNVGPRPDGAFPQPVIDRLAEVGDWLRVHGETIYGSEPVTAHYNYHVATRKGKLVHIHFRWGENLHWPAWGPYWLYGVEERVESAFIPATGQSVPVLWQDGKVRLELPREYPGTMGTVALTLA